MRHLNDNQKSKRSFGIADRIMLTLAVVLPLVALSLVTYNVAVATTPDLLPMWAAVAVGFVIGVLVMFLGVAASGTDVMDIVVPSAIIIVLSLVLMPVASRMKEQRLRKKAMAPTQVQKRR